MADGAAVNRLCRHLVPLKDGTHLIYLCRLVPAKRTEKGHMIDGSPTARRNRTDKGTQADGKKKEQSTAEQSKARRNSREKKQRMKLNFDVDGETSGQKDTKKDTRRTTDLVLDNLGTQASSLKSSHGLADYAI